MDKFFIGLFARLLGSSTNLDNVVPVQRSQDAIRKATGSIYVDERNPLVIRGVGTQFSNFAVKDMLLLPKDIGYVTIKEIQSDDCLTILPVELSDEEATQLSLTNEKGVRVGTDFRLSPYVDQSTMFEQVIERLRNGQAVGIFPEGGSHDRPEMLPLKAGVAIMALETMQKYPGTKLKIIPTGLHYFNADKFRSRAVLEYGEPIILPIELVDQYAKGGASKREAIGTLLDTIQVRIKALTVQASDYDSLMVAQAARRLYQPDHPDINETYFMARRFAEAYSVMKDHERVVALTKEVLRYNRMLKVYGVKDHQVKNTEVSFRKAIVLLICRVVEVIGLTVLAAPVVILFSPLLILTRKVSHEKAKEALKGSKVKLQGKDVVTTWKLLTAIVVTPLLHLVYTTLTFTYFYFNQGLSMACKASLAIFLILPLLCAATIGLSDIARDVKNSISPLIVSIGNVMSSSQPLREMRLELQRDIRALVEDFGPVLFKDFDERRILKDYKH